MIDASHILAPALERLRAGGLVGYPTETVWGLAASAVSAPAVERLRRWKGRSDTAPISLLVAGADSLAACGIALDAGAQCLVDALWPGPLTLVVHCPDRFAPGIARSDGAVGLRCSPHPLAGALAAAAEAAGIGPLTATSLNRSGEPAAETFDQAQRLCGETPECPWVLPAADCDAYGEPVSTVLDWSGEAPRVLRPGALCAAQLAPALARARAARSAVASAAADERAAGPARQTP